MKILFLSQIVPYPPHGGVLQRGYNIIREISKKHDVHLLAFVHPEVLTSHAMVEESRGVLEGLCLTVDYFLLWPKRSPIHKAIALIAGAVYPRPFSALAHASRDFSRRMREIIDAHQIDIVHFDTIGLARYLACAREIPSVITHHNIESKLMVRRSKVEKNAFGRWYVARQARLLRRYEASQSPLFDVNVMMSLTDEADLLQIAPGICTSIVPNGVDLTYFQPKESNSETAIIYTGGMNMFANEDAVLFLLRDMWDEIKRAVPDVRFYIVGQDPTSEILDIAKRDSSIIVTGFVEDIRPYVARSAVYVVPIRVGGGTRLKVLDALAQGKAIVSTSVGCEGIQVTNGLDICIEDDSHRFIQQTVSLLRNEDRRRELGRAARKLAEDCYSWAGIGDVLDGVYREVGGNEK
jgi:glycosyltransferase involved in cell wall biosynthesis